MDKNHLKNYRRSKSVLLAELWTNTSYICRFKYFKKEVGANFDLLLKILGLFFKNLLFIYNKTHEKCIIFFLFSFLRNKVA